jgi:hypothetical protein
VRLRPFLAALLLPLVITAVTLAAVAWNRSGGRGPIVLTEREVHATTPGDDNTTASLWLSWQAPRQPRQARESGPRELRQGFAALELQDDARNVASGFSPKGSRLVLVGVDRDAATLERRYPDGRTHIITAATLSMPEDGSYADAMVVNLEPPRIHLSAERAAVLRGMFEVELWYGLRYEPWITAIRRR